MIVLLDSIALLFNCCPQNYSWILEFELFATCALIKLLIQQRLLLFAETKKGGILVAEFELYFHLKRKLS